MNLEVVLKVFVSDFGSGSTHSNQHCERAWRISALSK